MVERARRFNINVRADTDALVVAIAGELDIESAPHLRPCLMSAIETSDGHVVIDMAELTFIDSSGIDLLVTAHEHAVAAGRSLDVVNVGPRPLAVLEMTGVAATLVRHESA